MGGPSSIRETRLTSWWGERVGILMVCVTVVVRPWRSSQSCDCRRNRNLIRRLRVVFLVLIILTDKIGVTFFRVRVFLSGRRLALRVAALTWFALTGRRVTPFRLPIHPVVPVVKMVIPFFRVWLWAIPFTGRCGRRVNLLLMSPSLTLIISRLTFIVLMVPRWVFMIGMIIRVTRSGVGRVPVWRWTRRRSRTFPPGFLSPRGGVPSRPVNRRRKFRPRWSVIVWVMVWVPFWLC